MVSFVVHLNMILSIVAEDHVLMQTRDQVNLLDVASGGSMAQLSSSGLSSLNETVTRLEQSPNKGNWTTDEKTLLDTLLESLQNDFLKFLIGEHDEDQATWNDQLSAHNSCTADKTTRLGQNGDVFDEKVLLTEKKDIHAACRAAEWNWEDYNSFRCKGQAAGLMQISNSDREQMKRLAVVDKHREDYLKLTSSDHIPSDCEGDQRVFERQFCTWHVALASACKAWELCVAAANLGGLQTRLEAREGNRKKLKVVIMELRCRIKHLLKTFDVQSPSVFS